MQRFANKLAVVTGGGRGIGQEIARALAAEGAKVAVVSRSAASCGKAAEEINAAYPGSATAYAVDVDFLRPVLLPSMVGAWWQAERDGWSAAVTSRDGSRAHLVARVRA